MSSSASHLLSVSDDELVKLLGGKLKEKERTNEKMRELKRKCEELEGLKIEPFPLWKVVTDKQYKDISRRIFYRSWTSCLSECFER